MITREKLKKKTRRPNTDTKYLIGFLLLLFVICLVAVGGYLFDKHQAVKIKTEAITQTSVDLDSPKSGVRLINKRNFKVLKNEHSLKRIANQIDSTHIATYNVPLHNGTTFQIDRIRVFNLSNHKRNISKLVLSQNDSSIEQQADFRDQLLKYGSSHTEKMDDLRAYHFDLNNWQAAKSVPADHYVDLVVLTWKKGE